MARHHLKTCVACKRHLFGLEAQCPFCGKTQVAPLQVGPHRAVYALFAVMTLGFASAACSAYGAPPDEWETETPTVTTTLEEQVDETDGQL